MEWFVNNYVIKNLHCYESKVRVLDVGSCDVNGSYKQYFPTEIFEYHGLDMCEGKNVDIVPKYAYDWSEVENESFDVVISGQCLEHVEFPWVIFFEMCKVMKPNGLMCILTPRSQNRHRFPVDTFRYDVDGYIALCKYYNLIPLHVSQNKAPITATKEWFSHLGDCMLVAKKTRKMDWRYRCI